MYILNLKT